jgi:uncharacterized RDD family membrane protein YckC
MAQSEPNSGKRKCAGCGAELPASVPAELCPKCLLKLGMETREVMGPTGTIVIPPLPEQSRGLPQPGEQLGHYSIIRLLGAGGMGAAFEAEDLESGRRVALKVLSHTLDTPEARERFFREGRLAASINHPNSVYVFGTEEIGGTPVIAMELVAGGTLQERVRKRGPLPVRQAVDCVLQIVAGLDAAQRLGILHRDIKPSNCFQDTDGTVKIGDFGLSISTTVRVEPALTATGAFLGTPAFCSPEQLRGDELNARSDMYSVGATVFYLLTGRTPFEGKNPVQLLATVLEQRAPSPRKFRPEVPQGLARVVMRCLEKQPGERFKSYAELSKALAPYSTTAPTPATMGLRFVAGALDVFLLSFISMAILLPVFGSPMEYLNNLRRQPQFALGWLAAGFAVSVLYYAICESTWGATLGKLVCRLRVVGPKDSPPDFGRALVRALVYLAIPAIPYWLIYGANPQAYFRTSMLTQQTMGLLSPVLLASLFSTVRRRNGFASVHDLLTGTRVVGRVALPARPAIEVVETEPARVEPAVMVGPYHVLETLEKSEEGEWILGYDLRLLRKVWVCRVPERRQEVAVELRNVSRPTRLRWLAGRRSPGEYWDAYEAPTGKALVDLIGEPQPWSRVRFWLYDLAAEINAAEKDGTVPEVLEVDRVWITRDGVAKLLDFRAPGAPDVESNVSSLKSKVRDSVRGSESKVLSRDQRAEVGGQRSEVRGRTKEGGSQSSPTTRFLSEVAAAALGGRADGVEGAAYEPLVPLPMHARKFLESMVSLSPEAIVSSLKALLQRAAAVTRVRRIAIVAGCVVFPLMASVGGAFGMRMLARLEKTNPGLLQLNMLLATRERAIHMPAANRSNFPEDRLVSIYVAQHFRATVTNDGWSTPMALAMIKGDARTFAESSVAEHPTLTQAEIDEADAAVDKLVPKSGLFTNGTLPDWFWLAAFGASLVFYVAAPALIAAVLFRGGLVLLISGVTFVRKDGSRAGRWQLLWRAIVTWCPLALAGVLYGAVHLALGAIAGILIAGMFLATIVAVSLALPRRGLQDRLAGTWPVMR